MSDPEMQMVNSSNIEAVGYDADNGAIYVRFLSGDTYVYSGADQGTFEELLNADSVGSYLNRVIKPNYEYSKL
jgi:KTSC domain